MQNKQHLWNIKHKHMHSQNYVTQDTTGKTDDDDHTDGFKYLLSVVLLVHGRQLLVQYVILFII